MKCLYTSRNNSFNHPIFQSKLLELLSRNYKNKKKITLESISFRQKQNTSKISHTNSYINSNTNTNTNSLIKQSGNNTKRRNSKTKIIINNMHQFSMSNDNFNEFNNNKKIKNLEFINTIYTTKKNSKNKNNQIINTYNNKKRSKNKSNNFINNEKSKSRNKKKKSYNKIMMINLDNDLSLKKENQILKIKIKELQTEIDKLKNENGLLTSQSRNQNSNISQKKENNEISNEKKTKKINKLNNNLNLKVDNIDNNYPCDYFNIIYSNNNCKSSSPIHYNINSNKKIYYNNILQDKNIRSYNTSKSIINLEKNGNYFTIGNNDKMKINNSNNSKILNSSKNKILLSMYNIKNKLNKSNSRLKTQTDKSYINSAIINTEKFLKNLKKNKIKEKLLSRQLIYGTNNNNINNEGNINNNSLNGKIINIALKKGKSSNLFKFHTKNNSLNQKDIKDNIQDKIKLNIKGNIKNIIIKKVESNRNLNKNSNSKNKDIEFNILKDKMENIYQRSKNLLFNYDKFIENNIKLNK